MHRGADGERQRIARIGRVDDLGDGRGAGHRVVGKHVDVGRDVAGDGDTGAAAIIIGAAATGQQPVPGRRVNARGFDVAPADLQIPVAAQRGSTCQVVGSRNIGAARFHQRRDGGLPACAGGKIAAIDQNVGIRREGIPDDGHFVRMPAADGSCCQPGVAEFQRAGAAMCKNMDRIDIITVRQITCNLLHPVLIAGEKDSLVARPDPGHDRVEVLKGAVDEHDLH